MGPPSDLHRPPRTGPAFWRMLLHRPMPIKPPVADLKYVFGLLRLRTLRRPDREKQNKLGIDQNRTVWQSPERRHGGLSYAIVGC
jgi:hypothetical protein